MSEYADIVIKNLSLCSFRNYLDKDIISLLFSSKDLIITPNCTFYLEDGSPYKCTKYEYKTTVANAKQRLDALGFSLSNFEKTFTNNMLKSIDYFHFLYHLKIDLEQYEDIIRERIYKNITFKKWKNAMHKIISYELLNGNIRSPLTSKNFCLRTECEKVIYYSLEELSNDSYYGLYPNIINIAYIYRMILESCNNDDAVILDFSCLQYWAEDSIKDAISATKNIEKTIVLVEGTSDKNILEYSMNKIYPHLSDLFYFMDFDDTYGGKRDGGTSYVIKNLKTFYFSKLKSKFIAVFDNDAEGYQSQCTLLREIKNWPDNFRILLYPQLDLFKKYPTLAPNETIILDDINKKACSIELYLPDIIIKSNEEYLPIEWESRKKIKLANGIEESIYQGAISQKNEIQNKFYQLKNSIESGQITFINKDWSRMKKLLDTIVFAFV